MTRKSRVAAIAGGLAAAFVASLALADAADARERRFGGSYVTDRGGVGTFSGVRRAEPGYRFGRTDWVRPDGRTGYRHAERSYGRTPYGWSGSARIERGYGDGTFRTREAYRNWDRDAGAYSRDVTRTFRDGSSAYGDFDAYRVGRGVWDYDQSYTTRRGQTYGRSGTVVFDRRY